MAILIVDDSKESRELLKTYLKMSGQKEVTAVASAKEAFAALGMNGHHHPLHYDLILMDVVMPEMGGIEALRHIRQDAHLSDIPVIMVTAMDEQESLHEAFTAGANDYIAKPVKKMELLARIRSLLRLRHEMNRRKEREHELTAALKQVSEMNRILTRLSAQDGLTGLANRRHFDEYFAAEWRRAQRDGTPLSVVMMDIDHFKAYNDRYGHQQGDDCLRQAAALIASGAKRPADLAARYGGEEFVLVLPETPFEGALRIAERVAQEFRSMKMPHAASSAAPYVTVSMGVASIVPQPGRGAEELLEQADKALYAAKHEGRDRVKGAAPEEGGGRERIIVTIDAELKELVPGFLEGRHADLAAVAAALEMGDMEEPRIIGHSMKGSGGGYGFEEITHIGAALESGAKAGDKAAVSAAVTRLKEYLARIDIRYA